MTYPLRRTPASIIYFLASMMGIFASAYESHVEMIAAYVLFAGSALSFISTARWSLWVPFIGSGVLACYIIPLEVRNILVHTEIFSDTQAVILHILLTSLVAVSTIVSFARLAISIKEENGNSKDNGAL